MDSSNKAEFWFGGPGSEVGKLNYPKGITCDDVGLMYVVDCNNCRVQVIDNEGKVVRVLGAVGSIGGTFATPQGVCIDPDGRVLVADTRNHRIQIFKDGELMAVLESSGMMKTSSGSRPHVR